jgi:hypothetical protein
MLAALSDEEISTLERWLRNDFVLLPPGWADRAAFAVLVFDEKKRRNVNA